MPPRFSKFQAFAATTHSPWTRDLRHVKAVFPRSWSASNRGGKFNPAKAKDRIKWWNVVPGDHVRVLGAKDDAIREVFRINRLSNRVLLKKGTDVSSEAQIASARSTSSVHYSRCQLYIGKHQYAPEDGSTEPRSLPVFATRVGMSTPKWIRAFHRYDWERYAENTVPRLPGWTKGSKERILIPWPKIQKRDPQRATAYDTPLDVVAEITYTPPPIPADPKAFVPKLPSEHEYITSLTAENPLNFPMEVYLAKELSNPHSRANIQKRWQAQQQHKKDLLLEVTRAELKNLQGRTRREARAEAVWKWKERLEEEHKAEIKRKWLDAKHTHMREKKERKDKKLERMNRKLRALALDNLPNQKVPGDSAGDVAKL